MSLTQGRKYDCLPNLHPRTQQAMGNGKHITALDKVASFFYQLSHLAALSFAKLKQ
jgi:hypothetical protein